MYIVDRQVRAHTHTHTRMHTHTETHTHAHIYTARTHDVFMEAISGKDVHPQLACG